MFLIWTERSKSLGVGSSLAVKTVMRLIEIVVAGDIASADQYSEGKETVRQVPLENLLLGFVLAVPGQQNGV